jgi:1-acyl-sn-glycerol-3-phosphate acyltransferase
MPVLYDTLGRGVLFPLHRLAWRLAVEGAERIPATGPVVLAPNHESLLDPFFLACITRRRVHYMAKAELWELKALPGFGAVMESFAAFPVRRGQSDGNAIDAALAVLDVGHVVGVFPQGTCLPYRERPWKRGAARLALESGCPLVPVAMVNTERALQPRTRKLGFPQVRVLVGEPLLPEGPATPEAAEELTARLEAAVTALRMPYGAPHHAWFD